MVAGRKDGPGLQVASAAEAELSTRRGSEGASQIQSAGSSPPSDEARLYGRGFMLTSPAHESGPYNGSRHSAGSAEAHGPC